MTREEFVTKVQDLVNQAYLYDIDPKYYEGLMHEAEKWRYPITLAEFLGWEEDTEYKRGGDIFKVEGNNLFEKGEECSSGWCNFYMLSDELIDLRNATKYEPKYYAKIKGWELIPGGYCYFGLDDNHDLEIKDACDAYEFTKGEWADLGITDGFADFEYRGVTGN